tara:strand:+ start:11925 stop:12620 length:696 start_codon:yes stop_codon:yes gene_type:complete
MPDFIRFDQRGYPMVSVREGYSAWLPTYEDTVQDEMDWALLRRVTSVDWPSIARAADLGCGTGRTGAWLHEHGVSGLSGVDLTPEMLERARERDVFDSLEVADVRESGLPAQSFDLVTCCLVDEHLENLEALYREARRLLRTGGRIVLVSYHPFFMMHAGMSTHFDHPERGPVAMPTHIHMPSDHVAAGLACGMTLAEHHERLIDDAWIETKPKWKSHRDWPISACWVWRA